MIFITNLIKKEPIDEYRQRVLTTINTPMSIIGPTNLTVQLDKFTTEFRWPFLLTNSSVTQCLLGLDFLIQNDCVKHAC